MTKDVTSTLRPATVSVNEDHEAIEIPEAVVIGQRILDLLSLLESHAGNAILEVPMVPKPPIPIPPPPTQAEPADKKWKRDKKGGKGSIKEGEIQEETPPEQNKVVKVTQSKQMRGGETLEMIQKCCSRVPN